jgi:hypothetical protein
MSLRIFFVESIAPTSLTKVKSLSEPAGNKQATVPRFQLNIGTLDMLNAAPILYPFLHTLAGEHLTAQ